MREIKFRGKAFSEQGSSCLPKWVFGSLIIADNGDTFVKQMFREEGVGYRSMLWQVDPESVGQYLGRNDKNDREVYEHDIIKTVFNKQKQNWLVEEIGAMERDNSHYGLCVSPDGNGVNYWIDKSILSGEVIGNIHDNPELLDA